jgi:RNA-directed DNA polymerase
MKHRHKSPYEQGNSIKRVLTGYFNYFAIPGNGKSLGVMRTEVGRLWVKALRRRSQKGRNLNCYLTMLSSHQSSIKSLKFK